MSGFARAAAKKFLGARPEDAELAYRNPYISPASPIFLGLAPDSPTRTTSFKGFPRTFTDNGRFDSFYGQVHHLWNAMVENPGKGVVTYKGVGGVGHNYLPIDWYDPDRTVKSKKILKWLGIEGR